jgi:primosomal protein N''
MDLRSLNNNEIHSAKKNVHFQSLFSIRSKILRKCFDSAKDPLTDITRQKKVCKWLISATAICLTRVLFQ